MMTCQPGTYSTSVGCGRAEIDALAGTEIYVGHWIKFSPSFTFNPLSTKIDYMNTALTSVTNGTKGAFTIREQNNGATIAVDITIQGNGPYLGPTNDITPHTVYAALNPPLTRGTWRWIEYRAKMNSVVCETGTLACVTPDGILQVWVDDVLQMSLSNVRWRDKAANTWFTLQHSAEWGGVGGTIPAIQYMWYDHTVISTTRIGRPSVGGDTTAPVAPASFIVR